MYVYVCVCVYPTNKYVSHKIRTIPSCYCYLNIVSSTT